jgi:hypothetical protein
MLKPIFCGKKMPEKSIFALTITQTKNCDEIYSHFAMAKLPLKNVSITLAPPLILFKQKCKRKTCVEGI